MRRPFREELERLHRDVERKYTLSLGLEEAGVGGGDNWMAIAYLLEEIDYLEDLLFEQCVITGQPLQSLLKRRTIAEMGEVALEQIMKINPTIV